MSKHFDMAQKGFDNSLAYLMSLKFSNELRTPRTSGAICFTFSIQLCAKLQSTTLPCTTLSSKAAAL
jgi:hypothetical protein